MAWIDNSGISSCLVDMNGDEITADIGTSYRIMKVTLEPTDTSGDGTRVGAGMLTYWAVPDGAAISEEP